MHQNIYAENIQQYLLTDFRPTFDHDKIINDISGDCHDVLKSLPNHGHCIENYVRNCNDCIGKRTDLFADIHLKDYHRKDISNVDFARRDGRSVPKKISFGNANTVTKSTSSGSISITGHFLNTTHNNRGSQNKVLFQQRSENLSRTFSSEDIDDFSYCLKADRYCSLRNLRSISDYSKEKFGSEKSRKQLKNTWMSTDYKVSIDPVIKDEEYQAWLIQNNVLKYSDLTRSNISAVSQPVTKGFETYSTIGREIILNKVASPSNKIDENRLMEVGYYNIYELIIYEHIVVIKFLTFFTSYFRLRRIKRLTYSDRILQILFFTLCYGVFEIVRASYLGWL